MEGWRGTLQQLEASIRRNDWLLSDPLPWVVASRIASQDKVGLALLRPLALARRIVGHDGPLLGHEKLRAAEPQVARRAARVVANCDAESMRQLLLGLPKTLADGWAAGLADDGRMRNSGLAACLALSGAVRDWLAHLLRSQGANLPACGQLDRDKLVTAYKKATGRPQAREESANFMTDVALGAGLLRLPETRAEAVPLLLAWCCPPPTRGHGKPNDLPAALTTLGLPVARETQVARWRPRLLLVHAPGHSLAKKLQRDCGAAELHLTWQTKPEDAPPDVAEALLAAGEKTGRYLSGVLLWALCRQLESLGCAQGLLRAACGLSPGPHRLVVASPPPRCQAGRTVLDAIAQVPGVCVYRYERFGFAEWDRLLLKDQELLVLGDEPGQVPAPQALLGFGRGEPSTAAKRRAAAETLARDLQAALQGQLAEQIAEAVRHVKKPPPQVELALPRAYLPCVGDIRELVTACRQEDQMRQKQTTETISAHSLRTKNLRRTPGRPAACSATPTCSGTPAPSAG